VILRATLHDLIVRRPLVEARQHGSCFGRNVTDLVIVAHEALDGGEISSIQHL
jgi:hypothetical protein